MGAKGKIKAVKEKIRLVQGAYRAQSRIVARFRRALHTASNRRDRMTVRLGGLWNKLEELETGTNRCL